MGIVSRVEVSHGEDDIRHALTPRKVKEAREPVVDLQHASNLDGPIRSCAQQVAQMVKGPLTHIPRACCSSPLTVDRAYYQIWSPIIDTFGVSIVVTGKRYRIIKFVNSDGNLRVYPET